MLRTEYITDKFSIKDLENLSGIKAHTIRIWETRYNILTPERSDSNIRSYSVENLRKLLNVTLLYNNGYKISKIAQLQENDLEAKVLEVGNTSTDDSLAIDGMKLATFAFNEHAFKAHYDELIAKKGVIEAFLKDISPFLNNLGLLWQSNNITPAHEHFASNIIKQKLLLAIEELPLPKRKENTQFVLFLPDNELHEIGLIFLNYFLRSRNLSSIFLGQSTPIDVMIDFKNNSRSTTFITNFIVHPTVAETQNYLNEFHEKLINNTKNKLLFFGRKEDQSLIENIIKVNSLDDFKKMIL